MASIRAGSVLRDLGVLFGVGGVTGLPDGELLSRFVTRRDEAGELAFTALVDRHGPMVLRVCLGLLGERGEAEDAFQATFLVLARKAGGLRPRDTIGPWLHAVAVRTARHVLANRVRRGRHEARAFASGPRVAPAGEAENVRAIVHQEVDRLPEMLRRPIVLCYLEGHTHEQAAALLCWPVGTVRSRMARGRARLRARLARRGIAPTVVLAADPCTVGRELIAATVHLVSGGVTIPAAGTPPAAIVFSRGVVNAMHRNALFKAATAIAAAGGLAAGTSGLVAYVTAGPIAARPVQSAPVPTADERSSEADKIAKDILHIDTELCSARDAFALGNTYATEDVAAHLFSRGGSKPREEVVRGQANLEAYYRSVFKDAGAVRPTNTLEYAKLVAPDLLVIQGRLSPDAGKVSRPFLQLRAKREGDWRLKELWLFPELEEGP